MAPTESDLLLSTSNKSTSLPSSITSPEVSCIVCGGSTVRQFSKEFLGAYVDYYRCLNCDHLTASEISENPDYDRASYFAEIDTGWQDRNQRVLEFVVMLSRMPGIALNSRSVILDYGCGIGSLVKSLNYAGFVAYGFEPYQESIDAPEHTARDWDQVRRVAGHANLVTCIEVLEHLRNPDEVLDKISELLHPDGYLFVSTEPYIRRKHRIDWYYLNPAAGHVSIYSEKSFLSLVSRHGYSPICRISGSIWLLRLTRLRRKRWLESCYYMASNLRVKLGVRIRY